MCDGHRPPVRRSPARGALVVKPSVEPAGAVWTDPGPVSVRFLEPGHRPAPKAYGARELRPERAVSTPLRQPDSAFTVATPRR